MRATILLCAVLAITAGCDDPAQSDASVAGDASIADAETPDTSPNEDAEPQADAEPGDAEPGDSGIVGNLQGTAAKGAPITSAALVLKDRNGTERSATTNATTGRYQLDVSGLTPPFLLRVAPAAGPAIFGVAMETGIANLHPITDLIIGVFYEVHGTDVATAFAALNSTTPVPTPLEVETLEALFRRMLQKWLQDAGLNTEMFDLITSEFDADGSGFDSVLDMVMITGDTVTVSDGATTQTSTITAETSGEVQVDTAVRNQSGGESTSTDAIAIPPSEPARTLEEKVEEAVQTFKDAVNTQGVALEDTHLLPFLSPAFLDGGVPRDIFAASLATMFRGNMILTAGIGRIIAYDSTANTLDVALHISIDFGTQIFTGELAMRFVESGETALMYGDQAIVRIQHAVQTEMRTDSFAMNTSTYQGINVDVEGPVGTIDGVSISGGPFMNTALMPSQTTRTEMFEPQPGVMLDFVKDAFFANTGPLANIPPAGTPFTIDVVPAMGPSASYVVTSNGVSGEPLVYQTMPSTHSMSAILGQTITVSWSLPTTYAVAETRVSGHVRDAMTEVRIGDELDLDPTATVGMIEFPLTMPGTGNTILEASFNLSINGPNGERSIVIYAYDAP